MAITKEEILAKCSSDLIASRDCQAIAALASIGRTQPSGLSVGNGTIITAIGDLTTANQFLDVLHTDSRFKYIVPLLEQGRLVVSDPLVTTTVQAFVPAVLTQDQANKILALAVIPDSVTAQEVADALYNPDGSMK